MAIRENSPMQEDYILKMPYLACSYSLKAYLMRWTKGVGSTYREVLMKRGKLHWYHGIKFVCQRNKEG